MQTPPPAETPAVDRSRADFPKKQGYATYALSIDGVPAGYAFRSEDELFVDPTPLLARCGIEDCASTVDGGHLLMDGGERFSLETRVGSYYLAVNGRYFYAPKEFLTRGRTVFLPGEVLQRIFHVTIEEDARQESADIRTEELELVEGGEYYYDVNFSGDDLYWLSHIIQAEADNQQLPAMIGVGNVVLNRTRAAGYPDTVFEVIFDYQNASQFSPKRGTSLSRLISDDVWVATCLCFEGYNTVGPCLYFQNPYGVETNWITYARQYALTLGSLDFYY